MKHESLTAGLVALIIGSLCLVLITLVSAAPGDLDTTFAGTGKTRLGFRGGADQAHAQAVQSDGKILVAGLGANNFALLRYNTDGSIDSSFDGDGKVITNIGNFRSVANAVKIQTDGKIVVAGHTIRNIDTGSVPQVFAVVRYNADGSLDTSFDGDGKVTTTLAGSNLGSMARANAMVIQPDAKIVVVGSSDSGFTSNFSDFAVLRYNSDGSPDTSFDLDGQVTTPIGTSGDVANAVVTRSGKIIVAGSSLSSLNNDFAVVRYNSDGSLDSSWGQGGKLTLPGASNSVATAVGIQSGSLTEADKIVVAGFNDIVVLGDSNFEIVRYDLGGSLDSSFDTDGKVQTSIGSGADRAFALAITGAGTNPRKIILAGASQRAGSLGSDFAVVRYNANGSLDTAFDLDGIVTTAVDPANTDVVRALAVQTNGKIVVAGISANSSSASFNDFAIVRYNSDGSLDSTFDGDGKRTDDVSDAPAGATSVALQKNGKVVAAGSNFRFDGNSNRFDFAVVRWNSDGSPDSSFGGDGRVTTAISVTAAISGFCGSCGAAAVAIQADDKIVTTGLAISSSDGDEVIALARYNSDGSLDTSFDNDGIVTTAMAAAGGRAMVIQADGKIVVAGTSSHGDGGNIAVVRYNIDGSLDLTFSGGKVTTIIPGAQAANAVAIQTDGKIVVAGSDKGAFAIVRYNPNGSIDTSFDNDGIVTSPIGPGDDSGNAVSIQVDGKIVVAGVSSNNLAVARYNPNGFPDGSFNGTGKVINSGLGGANGMVIQANGKILLASRSFGGQDSDFAVVRYDSNGALDASFGNSGKVVVDISGGGDDVATAIALDATGKAVVAGGSNVVGGSSGLFGVMRLLGDPVATPTPTPTATPTPTPNPTPTPTPSPAGVQFSSASYSKNEGGPSTNITVTRTGNTSGASSVNFSTGNNSYVPCNTVSGVTTQNCDFIISSGTLTFAPGQTSRSFPIIIIDDLYVEGNETLSLSLSNPSGAVLGSSTATLTITDNDSVTPATNPLDDARYFAQQHYYDFLGRLPDQGGLDFWTSEIAQCGTNTACINERRVAVSNAFFFEPEYQQTASFVFLLYRASFGNNQPFPNPDPANVTEAKKLPRYLSFVRDRVQVVGGSDLAQTQLALANAFVQRPEFVTKYPLSLAVGAQFVDAVLATIRNDSGAELVSQRDTLIGHFNTGGRGMVMFHLANDYWNGCNRLPGSPPAPCVPVGHGVAVDNRPFIDAEYNRSFVYSQYSGYLRRDGDIGGFLFWLNQVSTAPPRNVAKQRAMVCSFITAEEYQRRFSSVVTHSNAECPP